MAIDILRKILEEANAQSENMSVEPEVEQSKLPDFSKPNNSAADNGKKLADYFNFPSLENLTSNTANNPSMPSTTPSEFPAALEKYNTDKSNNAQFSNNFLSNLLGKKDRASTMMQGVDQEETPINLTESSINTTPAPVPKSDSSEPSSTRIQSKTSQNIQAPSEDTTKDIEYEQAQQLAQRNRESANINDLMAGLSNAIIGQAGSDMSKNKIAAIGRQLETSDQSLVDLNTQRDQYKKFLANKEEREKNDPNSAVSVAMKDTLGQMGVNLPKGATYATMEKLAPQIMKNKEFQLKMQELHQKNIELAQNKEILKQDKSQSKARDTAFKFQKAAQSDPTFKAARSSLDEKDTLNNLLEDAYRNGGQSVQALGTRMAKFMGEKGMLSEADTKKYISNPSLLGKLSSETYLKGQGKINQNDFNNIKRLLGEIGKAQEANVKRVYKYHAKNFSKIENITPEQAENLINPDYEQNIETKPKTVVQNGHTFTLNESTGEYE
jgi:hypothetical protein